jgi:hypothetical protein
MHQGTVKQNLGQLAWKIIGMMAIVAIWTGASAQKVIVLTDADLGREVASSYRFTDGGNTLTLTLKHRLGAVGPIEIQSSKAGQFDGPFQITQALPLTLLPGESRDITLTANYGKSIKEASEILFALVPAGDKDTKRAISLKLSVSAEGRIMFWDEKNKKYVTGLGTLTFDGPGERLIEIAWNGGTPSAVTFSSEGDARGGFKVIPNASGAKPLAPGSSIPMGKGGNSFFVKYDGLAKRSAPADLAKISFADATGKTVTVDLFGTFKGGAKVLASTPKPGDPNYNPAGGVGTLNLGQGTAKVVTNPNEVITHSSGIPGVNPKFGLAGSGLAPAPGTAKPAVPAPNPIAAAPRLPGSISDPVMAQAHLASFFAIRRDKNLISNPEVLFSHVDGRLTARFKIVLDSLEADKSMNISPVWVSAVSGEDSVPIPMTNVEFDQDSLLLRVILPEDADEVVYKEDSFHLRVGFLPEYLAGNQPVYLPDQKAVFMGDTIGRIVSVSRFWLYFWLITVLVIGLFFLIGWLWIRRPISTFRYLRESRYQRERYIGRDEDYQIDIETVHIDLNRRETDLVQLAFNLGPDSGVTGPKDTTGKVKSLEANVTAPRNNAFKRFYLWFFGIFGRSKDPRFRSIYYSLRIEPIKGNIPQALRLKDESGLLLLGSTLTGNVLATDHQDFRFSQRPFYYRVYVDPAEILDYTGTMRTVTIPFRVIEEPFEGYVMTREFRLNLEIHNKV